MKKIQNGIFQKKKKEILFGSIGAVLVIIVLIVFVGAIQFVIQNLSHALEIDSQRPASTQFNIAPLQSIGIQPQTTPSQETQPVN